MDEERPSRERVQAEEALLEPPLPRTAPLPPRLFVNRPFTWLVAQTGLSQLGFWAFFVAILGQAGYRYGAKPFELGILFGSFSVSFLLLTAPFGMVVDRWSPKWFLAAAQVVSLLAVVAALAGDSLGWLYVSSVIDGVGAAAAIPARGSLTALLVDERSLVRANGMLNTASMLAVVFGPGIGGLLLRHTGRTGIFWFIAATVGAGAFVLLAVPDRRPRGSTQPSFVEDLVDGFRVSWQEPELRSLLFLAGSAWFLLTVVVTLEPLFVKEVLRRGVDSLGYLWSSHGAGAFVGALIVARSKRAQGREVWVLGLSSILGGVGLLAYVGTSLWPVAIAGNVVFGVAFAWFMSLNQALIQRVTVENMRGRVTGVVGMLQETTALVGALGIAALGGLVVVQPFLVGSAVLYGISGVYGVRAGRRFARRLADHASVGDGSHETTRDGVRADA